MYIGGVAGGISAASDATFTATNSKFINNSSIVSQIDTVRETKQGLGGSRVEESIFLNVSSGNGGCFYIMSGAKYYVTNCVFEGNFSGKDGGVAYVYSGEFNAKDCSFNNNKSINGTGGVIYIGALLEPSHKATAENCTFTGNISKYGGGAVFVANSKSEFLATNCTFSGNKTHFNNFYNDFELKKDWIYNQWDHLRGGGAIGIYNNAFAMAENCRFINNSSDNMGGAVFIGSGCNFVVNNSLFDGNFVNPKKEGMSSLGGALYMKSTAQKYILVALNCTFINNKADSGGAIYMHWAQVHIFHCTFDNNSAEEAGGGVMIFSDQNGFFSSEANIYNCIFTGNKVKGRSSATTQLTYDAKGKHKMNGKNLIEDGSTVTRSKVFGSNSLTKDGYIIPLAFAKTAIRMSNFKLELPTDVHKKPITTLEDLLAPLLKDQAGNPRPTTGHVTYGSVEAK